MGKYIFYIVMVAIIAFALEFFQVVDIPYLEIPDYMSGKAEMTQKTERMVDDID
jgi:hypothetical protein